MRALLLSVLLLTIALPAPVSAQTTLATIEPTLYFWDDYSTSRAHFQVRITNPGGAADAFTITDVRIEPSIAQPIAAFYSPSPTLPLAAGAQGNFELWVGGFDQPSPPGPAAGNYTVHVTVQSTTDAGRQQTLAATIQRTHPADAANGRITGSLRDARTGAAPQAYGPLEVVAYDAESLRVLPEAVARKSPGADGAFSFDLPPGRYWLRAEASGYQTAYVGPMTVTSGSESSADVSISPNAVGRFESQSPRTVDLGVPTYRLAGAIDLSTVATTPGGGARPSGAGADVVTLLGADAQARWSRALPSSSQVPFDNALWDIGAHGVDVSADGFRVAVGTSGGSIEIYAADGKPVGVPYRGESDVNPLVPGPLGRGLLRSSEVRFSHDGTRLAAGSLTGWVYMFDAINGTLLWKTPTAGQVRALRFDPLDDRLYAGSGDNKLYALDPNTGTIVWSAPLQSWPREHIAITSDGKLIATGGHDGILRLFDDAGRLQWSRALPGPIMGFDVAPNGQQVLAMTEQGIHSFNRAGLLRWFRGEADNHGHLDLGAGGTYIGYGKKVMSDEQPAMRILYNDGTLAWEHKTSGPEAIHNVLPLDDGTRMVANGDSGTVYFFEYWTIPPTSTRGPGVSSDASPGGGSSGLGAVALLLVLGWVAMRRRRD